MAKEGKVSLLLRADERVAKIAVPERELSSDAARKTARSPVDNTYFIY